MIRAFLVDDEELAIRRLSRLLKETSRVEIAGSSTDPIDAIAWLSSNTADVVFLDIQMPGMTGFEMLAMLDPQPTVIFTTAYDRFALEAFKVNSIDYLLKPVEQEHLDRALLKLERLQSPKQDLGALLKQLTARYPERIASKVGDRVQLVELPKVSHFYAEDKLTFAAAKGKNFAVDHTIGELEEKLDPTKFYRIHRSTILNLAWAQEMDAWFSGGVLVRLKDEKATELAVARDRVRGLKERLGI